MRYFLIGYMFQNGYGSMLVKSTGFPSLKFIQEQNTDKPKIAIISIYEFKNEQDYNDHLE